MKNKHLTITSIITLIISSSAFAEISLEESIHTAPENTKMSGSTGKISPERLESLQKLLDKGGEAPAPKEPKAVGKLSKERIEVFGKSIIKEPEE